MNLVAFHVSGPSPYGSMPDGASLKIGPEGIDLIISLSAPTETEIKAIRFGSLQAGLATAPGIATAMLAWRFQDAAGSTWLDSPFNICLNPYPLGWTLPERLPHQHFGISIVLQDEKRIVRALRYITAPPQLSKALEDVAHKQVELAVSGRWSLSMYNPEIDDMNRRWPNIREVMRNSRRFKLGE